MNPELRKKLLKRKKSLKERAGGNNNLIFLKADSTIRCRALPVGETAEPGREVVFFYLGNTVKGVISPATFGEPCAIMEYYNKLQKDNAEDDKQLLKDMKPKQRFALPVIKYMDLKGKQVDDATGVKLMLLNNGQYQDVIDNFLDVDEWGDPTDVKSGYDFKFTREGKTQFDTKYSTKTCQKSPTPIKYRKQINIEDMIRKEIPTYAETKSKLNTFLGREEGEEGVKKKKKKVGGGIDFKKKLKKKKPSSDI